MISYHWQGGGSACREWGPKIAVFANPLTRDIPPYDPGMRALALFFLALGDLEERICDPTMRSLG